MWHSFFLQFLSLNVCHFSSFHCKCTKLLKYNCENVRKKIGSKKLHAISDSFMQTRGGMHNIFHSHGHTHAHLSHRLLSSHRRHILNAPRAQKKHIVFTVNHTHQFQSVGSFVVVFFYRILTLIECSCDPVAVPFRSVPFRWCMKSCHIIACFYRANHFLSEHQSINQCACLSAQAHMRYRSFSRSLIHYVVNVSNSIQKTNNHLAISNSKFVAGFGQFRFWTRNVLI